MCENIRSLRVHGRTGIRGEFDEVGYNARLSNINSVVCLAKLKKLDEWIDSKREICKVYDEELPNIVQIPLQRPDSYHTFYAYVIQCPDNTRDALEKFLQDNGIQTRISWPMGVHMTQAYGVYCLDSLPKTENVTKNILSLPCYHTLRDQDHVIQKVKEFYG